MRQNPLGDALAFLVATDKLWFTVVFWLLLLGSAAAALRAWRADPAQRSVQHVGYGLIRVIIGIMWWQQSLWKIPPHYDWGLIHWMEEMVEHASTQLQSVLVRDLVLPNIAVFGPLVYAIEVAIAVSLILGVVTRLGAALGALMAINLWLGLYNAPGEWPWTYMFLVVLQLIFLLYPPGRSLGVDALVWRRVGASHKGVPMLYLVS
ncbi:MAG: DoxX family membrane protein [Xanthobacteraceae bacterium]